MPGHVPVASLPMYDWPELAWANDALWAAISARLNAAGIAAPKTLDRTRATEHIWCDPGLLLSQTCGYPFATHLSRSVRLVETPGYDVEGCDGPLYSSAIVVRREQANAALADFNGRRIAFNGRDSLSGYVALLAALKEAGLEPTAFDWIETGSHRASIRAVANGAADLAAIDSVCWEFGRRLEPAAVSRLIVLARTPLRPGLPYVTAASRSDDEISTLRRVLHEAFDDPEIEAARRALHLRDLVALDAADYEPIAALEV